jgi:hypothetical protein
VTLIQLFGPQTARRSNFLAFDLKTEWPFGQSFPGVALARSENPPDPLVRPVKHGITGAKVSRFEARFWLQKEGSWIHRKVHPQLKRYYL